MRTARLINSEAELNNFFELESLQLVPETQARLSLRLFDAQRDLRYIPPATAVLKIYLQTTTGELEKTMSLIDADDRSMWTVNLDASDTENLIGGNVRFELDPLGDQSFFEIGLIKNAISIMTVSC